ncbi:hypothetical protein H5410_022715 [Solanum commersonii]|uniref:Uncharacterized protein n=1 Tax=Solanum commersonii TaxID=4109 RepID=A0A9J5ZFK2_SOLCO|nr:hypothetical protein H5410_022715 [Solanum commersonii]
MADPPPSKEANFIWVFDGLAVQPLDRTFYALHMTATYQENVEDFPVEFQNVNFKTDDIILDELFNDIFPNPTNDDAFQSPSCMPYCLRSESGLDSSQINPHSFGQPKSQLMVSSNDASRTSNSTLGYFLGEAPVSKNPVHFSLNLGKKPAPKIRKNVEKKKSEVKTKKVVSVSFLGVLFFMMLFGGLVPLLKLRYGGYSRKYDGKGHSSHCEWGVHGESNQKNTNKAADKFVHVGNGSDPLAASLYVPRNDKLVVIDGNLIIQYVLASEIAMAFHGSANMKNREVGLTVPGSLLSSGMCTEVFQFDASASGSKSLSRIFVVMLIDSVNYVTYSCMLPFKGSAPLVNAPEDGVFM